MHHRHALLARAVRTAIHHPIGLDSMTNDSAPTTMTGGSKRLNSALKTIEGMRRISRHYHKGFVVFIPAGFTQCHVDNSFFALGEGRCCRCARTTVQMIREPDTQCTRAAYGARLVRYVLTTQRECTLLGRRWLRLRQIPPASVYIVAGAKLSISKLVP